MKLQSQVSRIHQGKEYIKKWIVIPVKILEKISWKESQELEAEVIDDKIIIGKKKNEI